VPTGLGEGMAAIELRNVSKSFGGADVLRAVSLTVAAGEFLTILGPSGCGKSTLLKIVAGLEEQTSGEVLIDGAPADHLRPKARDIAMVFQSYALYPHLTVFDNLALPLRMRWLSPAQRLPLVGRLLDRGRAARRRIERAVEETAQLIEISHLLARKPGPLSGGQRQRVALGRALVRKPKAFLMDEPLSNLDARLRLSMRQELAALHRRLGATFVYVTHDQIEAMTMSDRIAVMMDGELLQIDTPRAVYQRPSHRKVAEFIGSPPINLLPTRMEHGRIRLGGIMLSGHWSLPDGEIVTVGLRPDALAIKPEAHGGWRGEVVNLENMGADLFAHVRSPLCANPMIVRTSLHQGAALRIGDPVSVVRHTLEPPLVFRADGQRLDASREILSEVVNG
jgi:multiple sugar transport system ATP-binding protein